MQAFLFYSEVPGPSTISMEKWNQKINSSGRFRTLVGDSLISVWITVMKRYQKLDMIIWGKMAKNGMSKNPNKIMNWFFWIRKVQDSGSGQRVDTQTMASSKDKNPWSEYSNRNWLTMKLVQFKGLLLLKSLPKTGRPQHAPLFLQDFQV